MPPLHRRRPSIHHVTFSVLHIIYFSTLHGLLMVTSLEELKTTCGPGEWQCGGGVGTDIQWTEQSQQNIQCISQNRFCDGIENCDDGSDEPIGCTNCNQTFIGESTIKYPLRVTGPFQRYLPFVCRISFVAGGKEFGDFIELTFLSFQVGRLEFTRNQTPICQKGFLKISEEVRHQSSTDDYDLSRWNPFFPTVRGNAPHTDLKREIPLKPDFGQFCGSLVERSVSYFSESNNVSILAVVPSRASTISVSFSLYLTYRFLTKKFQLPDRAPGEPFPYLGGAVPGTYCDRIFNDCSSPHRRCTIRSPNFPGLYPRNVTCQYLVRQQHVPEGHVARIVLSQPNDYKLSVPTGRISSTTGTSFLLSTDCIGGDIVKIYDGPSVRSPILLEFCGSGSLPEVVSSKGEVLVNIYSAPYQLMRSSRVEIDVQVRFEKGDGGSIVSHGISGGTDGRCSQTFFGTRQRVGLVRSPIYSMPRNANCTFRFIGASNNDRVWIYFTSFYSFLEKRSTSSGEDQEICSSRLEIFDSNHSENTTSGTDKPTLEEPIASFCGDITPRICAHAADYPPSYLPPRPCDTKSESYLSTGSDFTIRHRFSTPVSDIVTTMTSSFMARYEFVDTRQSGTAIEHTHCDRRFDSRIAQFGTLQNPRNVFLYGRGGKQNISCMYHFIGLPTETVKITLKRIMLSFNNSSCKMSYDSVLQKHTCKWLRRSSSVSSFYEILPDDSYGTLNAVEYWDGYTSTLGCLCNTSVDIRQPPVIFESLVNNVKLTLTVNGMSPLKDFDDYGFYAEYEFVNSTACSVGLYRHTAANGESILNYQVPQETLNLSIRQGYQSQSVRCRWLIEASVHKYLYLKFKGFNVTSSDKCQYGNKVLVYLDPRSKPVAKACIDERRRTSKDLWIEFDIFSRIWYNDSLGYGDSRDRLFVEVIANSRDSRGTFELHWLEVTKPFVKTQSGQTLRNVDCLFECPEIGACIDPELWCDGTHHCPSGYDESLEHCRTFPTAYVSSSIVGVALLLFSVIWMMIRRRRIKRRTQDKKIQRLPKDNSSCIESPIDDILNGF